MRLFKLLLLTLAIIFMSTGTSYADNMYVGAKLGFSHVSAKDVSITNLVGTESDNDTVFSGGVAVGYDFTPIRSELEFLMLADVTGEGSIGGINGAVMDYSVKTLMANVYYDFNTSTNFTPYVMAGLGFAFVDTEFSDTRGFNLSGDGDDSNFAWAVGLGVGYDINENITLDAEYRFMNLGSVETSTALNGVSIPNGTIDTDDLYANMFHIGVRYNF